MPDRIAWRRTSFAPAAAAFVTIFLVLAGFSLSVDLPKTKLGFQGDEATYYSLGHSLARDLDFTFERRDLVRVWEEFPGPEGIFLKRGKTVDLQRTGTLSLRFAWCGRRIRGRTVFITANPTSIP